MKQPPGDIVIVEGNNELNVQMVPLAAAMGFITLYGTGFDVKGSWCWFAQWYYAEIDRWRTNPDDYYTCRGPGDPCTPRDPINLNNLLIRVREGSPEYGWSLHGPFGPFVVSDGGVYTINVETGELTEGAA